MYPLDTVLETVRICIENDVGLVLSGLYYTAQGKVFDYVPKLLQQYKGEIELLELQGQCEACEKASETQVFKKARLLATGRDYLYVSDLVGDEQWISVCLDCAERVDERWIRSSKMDIRR